MGGCSGTGGTSCPATGAGSHELPNNIESENVDWVDSMLSAFRDFV